MILLLRVWGSIRFEGIEQLDKRGGVFEEYVGSDTEHLMGFSKKFHSVLLVGITGKSERRKKIRHKTICVYKAAV